MDALMFFVTLVSLATAGVMTALVLVLLHQERRRSEARVRTLSALCDDVALRSRPANRPLPSQERPVPSRLFREREVAPTWPKRALAVGLFSVVMVLAAGVLSWSQREPLPPPATPGAASLQLLALEHEQTSSGLVVTGVVLDPQVGRGKTRPIVATVSAIGLDGTAVASGRSVVVFTGPGTGDRARFSVTVQTGRAVAKYRVGFRSEDDRVIAHVDRRAHAPLSPGVQP